MSSPFALLARWWHSRQLGPRETWKPSEYSWSPRRVSGRRCCHRPRSRGSHWWGCAAAATARRPFDWPLPSVRDLHSGTCWAWDWPCGWRECLKARDFLFIKIHSWQTQKLLTKSIEQLVHVVVAFLLIIRHQPVQPWDMEQRVRQTCQFRYLLPSRIRGGDKVYHRQLSVLGIGLVLHKQPTILVALTANFHGFVECTEIGTICVGREREKREWLVGSQWFNSNSQWCHDLIRIYKYYEIRTYKLRTLIDHRAPQIEATYTCLRFQMSIRSDDKQYQLLKRC